MKLLENSSFDFLQLEFGDLKLTVSKSGFNPLTATPSVINEPAPSQKPKVRSAGQETAKVTERAQPAQPTIKEGTTPILAPMVGTFYTAPSPGAPPFVSLGDSVKSDTTVGLIEVMKVFNAVTAGATGKITEICVQNGQFVEYGQALFLIAPLGQQEDKDSAG
jgi:acetyl-CoA carboxylase biotin carboxyl carrier protein